MWGFYIFYNFSIFIWKKEYNKFFRMDKKKSCSNMCTGLCLVNICQFYIFNNENRRKIYKQSVLCFKHSSICKP